MLQKAQLSGKESWHEVWTYVVLPKVKNHGHHLKCGELVFVGVGISFTDPDDVNKVFRCEVEDYPDTTIGSCIFKVILVFLCCLLFS